MSTTLYGPDGTSAEFDSESGIFGGMWGGSTSSGTTPLTSSSSGFGGSIPLPQPRPADLGQNTVPDYSSGGTSASSFNELLGGPQTYTSAQTGQTYTTQSGATGAAGGQQTWQQWAAKMIGTTADDLGANIATWFERFGLIVLGIVIVVVGLVHVMKKGM